MKALRTSVALLATTLALTAAAAVPAQADHAWGDYHWARQTNPFTLVLGDNVSAAWDPYLRTSSTQWSVSSVLDTVVRAGSTTGKRCQAKAGRVEVCSASYGRNGWLGLASISVSGSHITRATVKLNDTYFSMAAYNNPEDRAHTMCQEIGHTFGLGHTSEDGTSQKTCMDYSSDPDSTDPNQHDYDQLAAIYAHLDSTTTVGAVTSAQSPRVGNTPRSWGREVGHTHDDGHHSTFVRELGHGQLIVTEVTWVE